MIIDRPEFNRLLFSEDERTDFWFQLNQHAGPTGFKIEPAAGGQDRIPKRLRIPAFPIHPPLVTIGWVLLDAIGIPRFGGKLISLGGDHKPVERLEMPTV